MITLTDRLRSAAARWSTGRGLVVAMVLGTTTGMLLAWGSSSALVAQPPVTIDNFTFSPTDLNVPAGTTVTWVNRDDIPHTVTSSDKKFRSKALDTNDSYSFTFTTPGTYNYFCSLHAQMVGKVIVN